MTSSTFDLNTFNVDLYDSILSRGLSKGKGNPDTQMCIESVICNVLGLPHDDDPKCVAKSVREFKIALNDKNWSSPTSRAAGLRDLGLAQLGSLNVVDDKEFTTKLSEKIIRVLIPKLFRQIFTDPSLLAAADRCETEGTRNAVAYAADAANATNAADAAYAANATDATDATDATYAAYAANAAYAAYAANAANATYAAYAANAASAYAYANAANATASASAYANNESNPDEYLILAANLALEVLQELNSPGCQLLKD